MKIDKKEVIIVCTLTFLALLVRIFGMLNFGDLWTDELYSYYFANQGSLVGIVKTLFREDFHSPLYFIILHYWINLFGSSDFVVRLVGCLISTLLIPASFYVGKSLFNRTTAYFTCIFLLISALHIHYSIELRFYGMTMLLSLLATYFYVRVVEDFNKKDVIAFILFDILLLYTFNFAFMYVFCQFLIGILYVFLKNKQKVGDILKIFSIIAVLYIPMIIMLIHFIFAYRESLLSFVRDIFAFDLIFPYTLSLSYFSNIFDQYVTNNLILNKKYLEIFFTPSSLIFMFTPVILGFLGFFRALKSKNQRVLLFLSPAICFLLIEFILAFSHQMALIIRYTVIIFPIILCGSILGWSLFKNKKMVYSILILWFFINSMFYFCSSSNALKRHNVYLGKVQSVLQEDVKVRANDYILCPRFGKIMDKFLPKNRIDFDTYDMLMVGNRRDNLNMVFGEELALKLNRKMLKTYLYNYLTQNFVSEDLNTFLVSNYFSKMEQNQRFIIVTDEVASINSYYLYLDKLRDIGVYKRSALYYPLSAKIASDIIKSCAINLKLKKVYQLNELVSIMVFEKD